MVRLCGKIYKAVQRGKLTFFFAKKDDLGTGGLVDAHRVDEVR